MGALVEYNITCECIVSVVGVPSGVCVHVVSTIAPYCGCSL